MKLKTYVVLTVALALLGSANAQSVDEGKKLFETNCTSCHAVQKEVVGPALKDVNKRRDEAWLTKWIKNSQAVIKSGDAYAVALAAKYNGAAMTSFGSLKDGEIKSILAYIKDESGKAPATTVIIDPKNPTGDPVDDMYSTKSLVTMIVIFFILAIASVMLGRLTVLLRQMYYKKHPEDESHEVNKSLWHDYIQPWITSWNKTVAVIMGVLIFALISAYYGFIYANHEVGVQKGYSPSQPINFSHKIHAGEYKINCMYCHYSAEKSKQASIPSSSTCMNCHTYVQAKDKYNGQISPEIQKIYTAVGYNAETKKYDRPQNPVKWVRIHNLPDHAVFNHSTHVKVGKVACQKCHGEVQGMDVVYQRNSLQMGWCINCHRESNVNVAGNAYYAKLHERMKKEGKTEIKVAENGGLECSKCHY